MTSLAFGVGVVPLVISNGAGSGGQNAIGTGVLGGVVFATVLGLLLIPVFFVVVRTLLGGRRRSLAPRVPVQSDAEEGR
jgi:multidrug efflux pump